MTDRQDEQRLIQALVRGDRSAWCQFVERFQGLVYARVSRTVLECCDRLDRADLEDLCAEVFVSLVANDYASLRRFEGRSSLATWLSVIARRVCLRNMQRRGSRGVLPAAGGDAAEHGNCDEHSPDALSTLIQTEDTNRLRSMLGQLNETDQLVLRLFYTEGASYAEMSRRLNVSINTIGPKLQRAQQRLRGLLEPKTCEPSSLSSPSRR